MGFHEKCCLRYFFISGNSMLRIYFLVFLDAYSVLTPEAIIDVSWEKNIAQDFKYKMKRAN